MSFSTKIYVGLASGITLGVFFGESMVFMHYPAEAFIELLHMTVLPYVTVSLIVGIGSLDYKHAVLMVRRVGAVLVALDIGAGDGVPHAASLPSLGDCVVFQRELAGA